MPNKELRLLNQGDKELAIASYEKSLELNPQNDNDRQILERLKESK